ncbi:hypothetical protein SDC9_45383 [bioreactor metagenome]|uniref:Lipoprotein n=1 Tax=bioreactor metagenome TaxID=1076179 RepID=A0A644W6G0_9ZZZZ
MKSIRFVFLSFIAYALVSCGGKSRSDQSSEVNNTSGECVKENSIQLVIEKQGDAKNKPVKYDNSFSVVSTYFSMSSDSVAEICLSDYKGGKEDNGIDILITLCSTHGHKISPATYTYMDFDADYYCKVRIATTSGTLWFSWDSSMPPPGNVSVCLAEDGCLAGSIALNVDKPVNPSVGVMKLNGQFHVCENR